MAVQLIQNRAYSLSRRTARSREDLKPWDSGLSLNNRSGIWQPPRQQRWRDVCEISDRYNHYDIQYRGFETWRDMMLALQVPHRDLYRPLLKLGQGRVDRLLRTLWATMTHWWCMSCFHVTHWGRHFQTHFLEWKCWKFHWSLFISVQLTIFQHWFRWWLGADQATSHYLNQWWLDYRRIYASLGLNEIN